MTVKIRPERRAGVRPLPRAKLDWVGSEVQKAKDIEAKIILQLKRKISRSDIASLADQKRKLLWLFYILGSGFMGEEYLRRLMADRQSDELVRLLHERISRSGERKLRRLCGASDRKDPNCCGGTSREAKPPRRR